MGHGKGFEKFRERVDKASEIVVSGEEAPIPPCPPATRVHYEYIPHSDHNGLKSRDTGYAINGRLVRVVCGLGEEVVERVQ